MAKARLCKMKDPTPLLNFLGTVFTVIAAWHIYITYHNPTVTLELMLGQLGNATIGVGAAIIAAIFFATSAIISAIQMRD